MAKANSLCGLFKVNNVVKIEDARGDGVNTFPVFEGTDGTASWCTESTVDTGNPDAGPCARVSTTRVTIGGLEIIIDRQNSECDHYK